MIDQRSHVVYRRLLLGAGHGYPFWVPEPDQSLPSEYRNRGIRIGDVGLMTEDGGFDFLFNVHHAAEHPINGGHVPPDFQCFPLVNNESPIREILHMHKAKSTITSGQVSKRALTLDVSAESPLFVGGGFGFEFSTTTTEAAILMLPGGATRYAAKSRAMYLKYAKQNGVALYQYVNGALGREAPNGSLYIVTGCDKCRSWGTAAVAQPEDTQEVSLKFMAGGLAEGNIAVHTSCSLDFGVETRCYPPFQGGPLCSQENQCVFARGIVIVLRENRLASKVRGAVHLSHISGSPKDRFWTPPSSSWVPYSSSSSSTSSTSSSASSSHSGQSRNTTLTDQPLHRHQMEAEEVAIESLTLNESSNVVACIENLPDYSGLALNPSTYIGQHVLSICPSADVAIVEDETWMKALEFHDNGAIDFDAVLNRVMEYYVVEEFDGVTILEHKGPLNERSFQNRMTTRSTPLAQSEPPLSHHRYVSPESFLREQDFLRGLPSDVPIHLDSLQNADSETSRPPYKMHQLVAVAIASRPDQKATLLQIYEMIIKRFPFYKVHHTEIMETIHHALVSYYLFQRVPHSAADPLGGLWKLNTVLDRPARRSTSVDRLSMHTPKMR